MSVGQRVTKMHIRDSANVEVKARCADILAAERWAIALGARLAGTDEQTDVYFVTRTGRLKLRVSTLTGAQLIPYMRQDDLGPKESIYEIIPVAHAEKTRSMLSEMLGEAITVVKHRTIYLWENVRIHLDSVDGLGTFIEFEAVFDRSVESAESQREKVNRLVDYFRIADGDLLDRSYRELLAESRPD